MIIQCEKQELIEAVSNVQRAVSAKSDNPALEGILLRAQGSTLYMAGFDRELGITTTIGATVKEPGEIVLTARMFSDIVRRMPGDHVAIQSDEKYNTILRSSNTEFSIKGMTATDYPDIPQVEDGVSFTFSQTVLRSMIRQTIFAVAPINGPRPIYTGSRFEMNKEQVRLVSVDGYRLAMRNEAINTDEQINFVVPGKTLLEVLKLLKDEEKPCSLIVGRRHIIFEIDGYAIISRLLDGEFMAYEKIISTETNVVVTVNSRELIDAVERVSLVIDDRLRSPLICELSEGKISLSCSTTLGYAVDAVEADTKGMEPNKNMEIGFNARYLSDALKNSESDEVRIELNGPTKPVKILPKEGDSFLFLVLPVRLNTNYGDN